MLSSILARIEMFLRKAATRDQKDAARHRDTSNVAVHICCVKYIIFFASPDLIAMFTILVIFELTIQSVLLKENVFLCDTSDFYN